MKRESRAPLIIAIVLLLLPVLYVGSYLVLVVPPEQLRNTRRIQTYLFGPYYRFGGQWSERFFWPLEQIDRKLRPGAWTRTLEEELERKFQKAAELIDALE